MTIERTVLAVAGALILLSLALAITISHDWLWLTAFVGLNLLQSAFTRFCPLAMILASLGMKSASDCVWTR